MSNHHGEPAFLITRAAKAVNPLDARRLLRQDNAYVGLPGRGRGSDRFDTDPAFPLPVDSGYDGRHAAFYDPEEPGVLVLADDAVLLMIGNTPELVKAVTEAKQRGLRMIRTGDEKPLQCYFARIKVSQWSPQARSWQSAQTIIIGVMCTTRLSKRDTFGTCPACPTSNLALTSAGCTSGLTSARRRPTPGKT
jgi:hypothetical protein